MARSKAQNQLRIIGGTWRGRKLKFPDLPGLRPTSDRVRETLFNWLQQDINNAICLDLYAGSGALGFEALSRGAQQLVFVDSQKRAVDQISENATLLNATKINIHHTDAQNYINKLCVETPFDIVFLDPPFHKNLLLECLIALQKTSCLTVDAKVYIESETAIDEVKIAEQWQILKSKITGNVHYYLITPICKAIS